MNYQIRPAISADIAAIITLCKEHAAYEQAIYDETGKADALSTYLFGEQPRLFCLVVEIDGQLMGYATYMPEFSTWDAAFYLHMDCLYLKETTRGNGIGEQLMKNLQQEANRLGCTHIQWQTPEFNERAIKFYTRIGAKAKSKVRFYLDL